MNGDESLQLRDFVAETIKQVIDGVAAAQQHAVKKGAVVNPRPSRYNTPLQSISFDVAVTAAKGTKTQGGRRCSPEHSALALKVNPNEAMKQ